MSKVLIVEDDEDSRFLLWKTLKPHFEDCHVAKNGREAVDAFVRSLTEKQPYDLICMDIIMPVMDGLSAVKQIRKIEQENHRDQFEMVRVLMITGTERTEIIMDMFIKESCEGYLKKPFNLDRLDDYLKAFGLYQTEA